LRTWRSCLAVTLPVLCAVAIAACGSSSSSSSSSASSASSSASSSTTASSSSSAATAAADPAVEALVPASVKSKGTLTVAADASYAPNEFIGPDGHTVVGMDADLSHALAAVMGLKANVINVPFASILAGMSAGKYDMGASSFTDTKAREKTVDFVDYFIAGESFFTKSQGGVSIGSIADICGHTVAVETGTTEKDDATTQSGKCTKAGKPAVTVLVYPDQNAANLALSSGRAQLGFADSPVAAYQVKQSNGVFKLVGASFANAPYGLAVPKNGLAKAILAALQDLMKNGTYTSILTKWGIQSGAIPAAMVKINGATS
jgi:polar amino acid transport system substrate-binding protein